MTPDHQKKFAAFYTPHQVTNILSNWAIRSVNDIILEPSFGGCNFLTSSLNTLTAIGKSNPEQNIHGFDIDPKAFLILNERGINDENFQLEDFLKSDRSDTLSVSVVLGNPPFLPIHKIKEEYKKSTCRRI